MDPVYSKVNSGYKTFLYDQQFEFKYNGGVIPQLQVAYETWGELNEAKDNVVLLCTGLSASSHAKSHPVSGHQIGKVSFVLPSHCSIQVKKESYS